MPNKKLFLSVSCDATPSATQLTVSLCLCSSGSIVRGKVRDRDEGVAGRIIENFISLEEVLVVPYLDDPSDAAAAVQAFNFELRTAICL